MAGEVPNQDSTKNKGGRPPQYKTPEEMQAVIDDYFNKDAWFEDGDKKEFRPTISGLAYALDLSTVSIRNYAIKDEFLSTVKRAKLKVEMALENRLYGNNVTGLIFNLKNNFGWKDKQEVDNTSSDGSFKPSSIILQGVRADDSSNDKDS